MLECSYKLNGKLESRFQIGNQSFLAFSGFEENINQKSQQCTPNSGPIPVGRYYVVDRVSGTLQKMAAFLTQKGDWFALYAIDEKVDDYTKCNSITRGEFRLHPAGEGGISLGCISVISASDYKIVHQLLKSQPPTIVTANGLKAYAIVTVS